MIHRKIISSVHLQLASYVYIFPRFDWCVTGSILGGQTSEKSVISWRWVTYASFFLQQIVESSSLEYTFHAIEHISTNLCKMFKSLVIASLVSSAVAFSPARSTAIRASSKLSMSAEFLPGALAPLGYFDPLSLSAGKTTGEVRKIREAELKHGR